MFSSTMWSILLCPCFPVDPGAQSSNLASTLNMLLVFVVCAHSLAPEGLNGRLSAAGDRFASQHIYGWDTFKTLIWCVSAYIWKCQPSEEPKTIQMPINQNQSDNSGLMYVRFCMGGSVLLTLCDSFSLDRHPLLLYEMNVPHNTNISVKLGLQQHPVINSFLEHNCVFLRWNVHF